MDTYAVEVPSYNLVSNTIESPPPYPHVFLSCLSLSLFLSFSSPYFRSQFDFGAFSDYAPEHTVVGFTANQASYNLEVGRREKSAPCSTVTACCIFERVIFFLRHP